MNKGKRVRLHLPLNLDKPRFSRRAGSPALTRSPRRRTEPAPLRIPGLVTGGRKAEGEQRTLTTGD